MEKTRRKNKKGLNKAELTEEYASIIRNNRPLFSLSDIIKRFKVPHDFYLEYKDEITIKSYLKHQNPPISFVNDLFINTAEGMRETGNLGVGNFRYIEYFNFIYYTIFRFYNIDELLLEKYEDCLGYLYLSNYQELSEEFIDRNPNKINWRAFLYDDYDRFSDEFFVKFSKEINWGSLYMSKKIYSDDFIKKHVNELKWDFSRIISSRIYYSSLKRKDRCEQIPIEFVDSVMLEAIFSCSSDNNISGLVSSCFNVILEKYNLPEWFLIKHLDTIFGNTGKLTDGQRHYVGLFKKNKKTPKATKDKILAMVELSNL
jgi:hypothetical protein